jgi:predicted 3-demethylubiquinone-9 3-methyltransferase (glyoxalase superfamily)
MQKTTTFLMFVGDKAGKAEEAMRFYTSLFMDSEIKSMTKYQADEQGGKKGMVKHAVFKLQGQEYMAIDSTAPHQFTFTPSISIFIQCEDEAEIDDLYKKLSQAGRELMPLDNYGFSRKFGWVNDRYGVSWQITCSDGLVRP